MTSQDQCFPNPWTNSSICWISRRPPTSQRVPMISSISQRLPQKTCGLFDTGFAGDAEQITSIVPTTAPADVLSELGLGGHYSSTTDFLDPSTSLYTHDNFLESLNSKDPQLQLDTTAVDEDNWDLLDDLPADPLGDDSLDAFINLDTLMGNSFFDEEGNLVQDVQPEEVTPVISIPTIEGLNQISFDLIQDPVDSIVQNSVQMVQWPNIEFAQISEPSTATVGKPVRQRKRKAQNEGVKTSLFEIPESVAAFDSTVEDQTDHSYGAAKPKRQKLADPLIKAGSTVAMVTDLDLEPKSICVEDSTSFENLDKQSVRRIKNNVASKRSREQRKQKLSALDIEAEELETRNEELRQKIVELEAIAQKMKQKLVAKMSGR